MIKIGEWNGDFHDDFEQVKRIESARSKKMRKEIVSVDKESGTMLIKGSAKEPYTVTLNECTCTDYSLRHLPCKHIYALAFELGLMDGLPEYNKKKSSFNPAYEIERYKALLQDGKISADAFAKICAAIGSADTASNPNFDPRPEIDRYKKLYQDGEIPADAYVKVCSVLAKMK